MLPSAVNDTMRDMMAQIRDVGDGIRDGTYTMTAPKITGGTITGVAFTGNTFTSPVISGGSINNTPIGASTANTGAFTTLSASGVATFSAGTVSAPAITTTGDTNTGIFFPAADTIAFTEGGVESMRIDSSGNVGIGTTSPLGKVDVSWGGRTASQIPAILVGANSDSTTRSNDTQKMGVIGAAHYTNAQSPVGLISSNSYASNNDVYLGGGFASVNAATTLSFWTAANSTTTQGTERMRITSGGDVLIGKTSLNSNAAGFEFRATNIGVFSRSGDAPLYVNRITNDGNLVLFGQDDTTEGTISVSGTTVSYNGGHLSRWSQLPSNQKDDTLLKGTVMSNLDDMCVWIKDGEVLPNEQLNKMKVSDVEGDTNVAGVFVDWQFDEQCQSDDMNVAMTGDMIIRIAQGVVVQKGDLLMSAGDGTAKPQGDDIVRSKTIAKVTSNHVTCTYADGSYCVPCVLMAC
jgi:hypothetical protein